MNREFAQKDLIRSILIQRVNAKRTITYGTLADKIGRRPRGPWPELDAIYEEEALENRPDLTLCVVLSETGMPSKYLGKSLSLADEQRAASFFKDLENLFAFYEKK